MPDETNKRQSGHHTGLSQAHDQVQELRMGIYITRITQHNMMHTQVGPCLPLLSTYVGTVRDCIISIIILYYTMQGCTVKIYSPELPW